jgi:PTS system glucitol/sorbitol-specific IIA component
VVAHSDPATSADSEKRLVLKYHAVIREVGPIVSEFLPHGILIFFGESAPEELREVSLIHDGTHLAFNLVVGDLLKFVPPLSKADDIPQPDSYRLTAVGEVANKNLAELGHLVVHFDGASTAPLPGTISVEPSLHTAPSVGATIEILGLEEK